LLVDGPPLPSVGEERTRAAALLGLRVELALADEAPWPGTLASDELLARAGRWLAQRGLAPAGGPHERRAALERLLAPTGPDAR
jgi:hypothetical protein